MCDIWKRQPQSGLHAAALNRHRESLRRLGIRHVVFTGGEPLLNADLSALTNFLHGLGIRLTLLTTGLLLKKRAVDVVRGFDDVIVSLDGPAPVHDSIRRVTGAFDLIHEGIYALRALRHDLPITARCTVQSANHLHLCDTVATAKSIGFDSISFLAADVSSAAFNRELLWPLPRQNEIALSSQEVDCLEAEIDRLITTHAADLASGLIVEGPEKLRRIARSFRAHLGQVDGESPSCNAPWVSAVVEMDGSVRPCFFHPPIGNITESSLEVVLTSLAAQKFRATLDVATNPTCRRCVCSLSHKKDSGLAHQLDEAAIQ